MEKSRIKKRTKRKQVKQACVPCRKKHIGCDDTRPCKQCVKKGIEHMCVDQARKRRKSVPSEQQQEAHARSNGFQKYRHPNEDLLELPKNLLEDVNKDNNVLKVDIQRLQTRIRDLETALRQEQNRSSHFLDLYLANRVPKEEIDRINEEIKFDPFGNSDSSAKSRLFPGPRV
eukprot:TRINITY_DN848_c0_g1_i1.p1 TRINITY_DN848_c0_g1~~TRINITY_DN848_c0_g1_i1.p1  ORF type:complete len:180 (-),score=35.38 TRINITY_DN848_c0_g1_i1:65-583(-)